MEDQQQITQDDVFDFGVWLGRRQAFASVANSCSAADAQSLKTIRDGKMYRARGYNWDEFCQNELRISRRTVESVIAQYEEFGTPYFDLAAITRLTPDTYRLIEPAVSQEGLAVDGKVIGIEPGNARDLAAGVETLRRRAVAGASVLDQLAKLEKLVGSAVKLLDRLVRAGMTDAERARLVIAAETAIENLNRAAGQASVL